MQVTDSKNHILFKKEDATKGKFAFTTENYDTFDICFETSMHMGGYGPDREVLPFLLHYMNYMVEKSTISFLSSFLLAIARSLANDTF